MNTKNQNNSPKIHNHLEWPDLKKFIFLMSTLLTGATVVYALLRLFELNTWSTVSIDNRFENSLQLVTPQAVPDLLNQGQAIEDTNYIYSIVKDGDDFRVNSYIADQQRTPTVTSLLNGDFVITWTSQNQDGEYTGIYAQRFNATGTPLGNEFRVNTYTAGYQSNPAIASLTNGDFVIAWASFGQIEDFKGVYAQRFNATGTPLENEFRVNTYTVNRQLQPAIAGLTNGDFVITWESDGQDGDREGIYAQCFSVIGVPLGNEFRVNSYVIGRQYAPTITALINGNFIIAWISIKPNSDHSEIYAQRYDPKGIPLGSEFAVSRVPLLNTFMMGIGLANGDFVIAWITRSWGDFAIYGQYYNWMGAAIGSHFLVTHNIASSFASFAITSLTDRHFVATWVQETQNTFDIYARRFHFIKTKPLDKFQVNTHTINKQLNPAIAGLSDGNFVITWESEGQDGSGYGIFGQLYYATGEKFGAEFRVNTNIANDQRFPAITALKQNQGFVITWVTCSSSGKTVFAQLYNWKGKPVGSEFQVSSYSGACVYGSPAIASLSNNDFIITTSAYSDGFGSGIYAQRFDYSGKPRGNGFQVNTYTTNSQYQSAVTDLINGNFVVAWMSDGQDGDRDGIYAQRYTATNAPLESEFQVNSNVLNKQNYPIIASLANGNFIIIWNNYVANSYSAQLYSLRGIPLGDEFRINAAEFVKTGESCAIASLPNGDFVVGWHGKKQIDDGYGIYFQRYDASGIRLGNEFSITNTTSTIFYEGRFVTTAGLPNGNFVVAWINDWGEDGSVDIYGQVINQSPIATLNIDSDDYLENNGPVAIYPDLTLKDGDSSMLQRATITFELESYVAGEDIVSFNSQNGITSYFDAMKGVLELGGESSVSNYQTALRSITYENHAEDPNITSRLFSLRVYDRYTSSTVIYKTFVVVAINDEAQIAANDTQPIYRENTAPVIINDAIEINDVDNDQLQGAEVSIKDNFQADADILSLSHPLSTISVKYNRFTGILNLNGKASVAVYQAALRTVQFYSESAHNPYPKPRIIRFRIKDMQDFGENYFDQSLAIQTINDAPALTHTSGVIIYAGNQDVVQVDDTLILADPDNVFLTRAIVRCVKHCQANQDRLIFVKQNSINGRYNNATGELILNGSSSLSNYQIALRSVAYQNTANTPNRAARFFNFSVFDGMLWSEPLQSQLHFKTLPEEPTTWDKVIERLIIALPTALGGIFLTFFTFWLRRHAIKNSWDKERFYIARALKQSLNLHLGYTTSAQSIDFVKEVDKLVKELKKISQKFDLKKLYQSEPEIFYLYITKIANYLRDNPEITWERIRYLHDLIPDLSCRQPSYQYMPGLLTKYKKPILAIFGQERAETNEVSEISIEVECEGIETKKSNEHGLELQKLVTQLQTQKSKVQQQQLEYQQTVKEIKEEQKRGIQQLREEIHNLKNNHNDISFTKKCGQKEKSQGVLIKTRNAQSSVKSDSKQSGLFSLNIFCNSSRKQHSIDDNSEDISLNNKQQEDFYDNRTCQNECLLQ